MLRDLDNDQRLLSALPTEIWTEGPDGQTLLELARAGLCKHVRVNATVGRFEPLSVKDCDCEPWPDKCPYCGENVAVSRS